MKIISISGLDGSGKSTQAKMLQDFLENKNKKVFYFHAVQFSLPQRLSALKNKILKKDEKKSSQENGVTSASSLKIKLRKLAFIIDVIRFHFFKKKLTKLGYDFIITDRYFYDSIVNIAYLQKRNTPPKIEKYIPPADAAFYLKLQPEAIMTRARVPEQGLQYLNDKKKLYDMYATLWDFIIIDASNPPQILFEKILSHLKK